MGQETQSKFIHLYPCPVPEVIIRFRHNFSKREQKAEKIGIHQGNVMARKTASINLVDFWAAQRSLPPA